MTRSQFGHINKEKEDKEEEFDLRLDDPFPISFENGWRDLRHDKDDNHRYSGKDQSEDIKLCEDET